MKLFWTVTGGEYEGREADRLCSQKMGPKAALRIFVKSLKGADLEPGEEVDMELFIGVQGMIVVEEHGEGFTRVASFLKQG